MALREREKEARSELDGWLRDEKSKDHSTDKEKRELKLALKSTKAELALKTEELQDVQEELASLKETSKERERGLKAKLKEAQDESRRLASMEVGCSRRERVARLIRSSTRRRPKRKLVRLGRWHKKPKHHPGPRASLCLPKKHRRRPDEPALARLRPSLRSEK